MKYTGLIMTDTNIKNENIYDSTHYTKCIDDRITYSLGKLDNNYSQTLEGKTHSETKYAILLIDMQNEFIKRIKEDEKENQIKAQIEVLKYCAQKDIPVVALEYKNCDNTINKLIYHINKVPRKKYLTKSYNNGFKKTNLNEQLEEWNITHVCLMGINASACVKQTAQGALNYKLSILTANQLISNEPGDEKNNKSIPWFKKKGLYYDDYKDLIKHIDSDTPIVNKA